MKDSKDKVEMELLERYWKITEEALQAAGSAVVKSKKKQADDFLSMANCYLSDSKYFAKKGNLVLAFGAVNYAHAWLDAGARTGLFNVKDNRLFAVDGEAAEK